MKPIKVKLIVEYCVDVWVNGADFILLTSEEARNVLLGEQSKLPPCV